MIGIRILDISQQELAQKLPVEYVDTHGGKIALRVFRFLLEFHDAVIFTGVHDTETAGFLHGNLDNCNSRICLMLDMVIKHLCIIHLIDVVTGKDQKVFRVL